MDCLEVLSLECTFTFAQLSSWVAKVDIIDYFHFYFWYHSSLSLNPLHCIGYGLETQLVIFRWCMEFKLINLNNIWINLDFIYVLLQKFICLFLFLTLVGTHSHSDCGCRCRGWIGWKIWTLYNWCYRNGSMCFCFWLFMGHIIILRGVVGVVGALGGKLRLWCRVLMGAGQCSGVNHQHLIKTVMKMRLLTKTKNVKNWNNHLDNNLESSVDTVDTVCNFDNVNIIDNVCDDLSHFWANLKQHQLVSR